MYEKCEVVLLNTYCNIFSGQRGKESYREHQVSEVGGRQACGKERINVLLNLIRSPGVVDF